MQALPGLHAIIDNNYVRGAVSGLGVVNVMLGLVELFGVLSTRRPYDDPLPAQPDFHPTDRS